MTKLKTIWSNKNISVQTKIRLMRSLVISIFIYACESWTLTADTEKRIKALEMRCYRRILGITYKDHITNAEVKTRIENSIGSYVDLLTTVKRRKLKWFGHVTRSTGLAKTTMHGEGKQAERKALEEMGKQHQRMDWHGAWRRNENSGRQS